jgi:hypothetical protein
MEPMLSGSLVTTAGRILRLQMEETPSSFGALENLDTERDVSKAWGTIRENIKMSAKESLGYYEPKKNKTWFDEGCKRNY